MDAKGQWSSVIMGDLVNSERSLPIQKLHELFNKAVDAQNVTRADALISPLTITLGDEFQGLVKTLAQAAVIARDLRLQLMADSIDCRFVVGRVEIKTPVNFNKAWNMMGAGLARARQKLNQKKANQFYRFSLEEAPITEMLLDTIGVGLSVIELGWTAKQRGDISAMINGLSPVELAKRRNVSVHSIYKVRDSGDFDAYSTHWAAINTALGEMDKLGRLS